MSDVDRNYMLKFIADHLIINSSELYEIGLYNGKMGIAIFFYHYSRFMNIGIYNDFADSLLEEVIRNVDSSISIRFRDGICGIGWAMQYLIKNNFVQSDGSNIFSDFDSKVLEYDLNKMNDRTLSSGSLGILCYILSRLLSMKEDKSDNMICNEMFENKFNTYNFGNLCVADYLKLNIESVLNLSIISELWRDVSFDRNVMNKLPLGIEGGLAGIGLKLVS